MLDLPRGPGGRTFDYQALAQRVRRLAGEKLVLRVRPAGAKEATEREVPLEGFTFADVIVGATKPQDTAAGVYNPFEVSELPQDPWHPNERRPDPFAFHDRLRQFVGLPMVVQVRRDGAPASDPPIDLFVPPAYHWTFGMRMKMGEVSALREASPADKAGLRKGDLLIKVVLKDEKGAVKTLEDLDPERLPDQLRAAARGVAGRKTVVLTVRRQSANPSEVELAPAEWDDSWDDAIETPLGPASPLSIPQLGLAYRVESRIVEVEPGGPADAKGLRKGDRIDEIRFRTWSSDLQGTSWGNPIELGIPRNGEKVYDGWARVFNLLQGNDHREVQLKVSRPDGEVQNPVELAAREDLTWPLADRGIKLQADYSLEKADGLGQALAMGARKTGRMIKLLYLQLHSLLTGRVSAKQVGGPVEMIAQGFTFARMGFYELLLFLGMISINLAVVNFLPIPILDGGHMVFLIYEKLRGRPPSETVRAVATYIGLAAIGSLIIFVFRNDFNKHIKPLLPWF
jgi:regulator of sigma E protease